MALWFNKHLNKLMYTSGALIIIGLIFMFLGYSAVRDITFVLATLIGIGPIIHRAWSALMVKSFSIELLITIAVAGALFIQEFTEGAIVTFLFLFGAFLEKRTLAKTRSSIQSLLDMAPNTARVMREGEIVEVDIDEVAVGETVIVQPGGKIPVDGTIIKGTAQINESAISGESVLQNKTLKDEVFSGSVIDTGYIELEAVKVGEDTTFSKIIEMVEEASERKSGTEKFLNRFAQYYTPGIVVLAVLVGIITQNIHLAITFLVIACPGALIIGAPVAYVAGIGNSAKKGVLVKGGETIDQFAKIDTVIFDKTGTLTEGRPSVTSVAVYNDMSEDEVLAISASLEQVSEHHLGRTIIKEAEDRKLGDRLEVEDPEAIKARGVSGVIGTDKYYIGNKKLIDEQNIKISDTILENYISEQKEGQTAIFITKNDEVIGLISIMDRIKEDALEAVKTLRDKGAKKLVMLTGDNRYAAEKVANILGLDEFHAELLPDEKMAYIEEEQAENSKVMMVGDGINDAPALALSDVGVAIGHGGTDIAMETADVVLMSQKLSKLAIGYTMSRLTFNVMLQNTAIALLTVVLLLLGVVYGYIHLASGMLIHQASVLAVILNAMRLMPMNRKDNEEEVTAKEATA
ncbi:heavy metal translocating P-type ATPase [Lacicoccus alkaliphilus]|uniref:Cd(2+)-exporting ATPase n=1 Tax=Lacicoccus alkaliphilus DSM 16010 TaxID=1123231 RepID=A0A1M7E4Z9_9BACL|nr:cation-translocating P-type ATPase [Salinicoccus alkaliphilus]SHL86479.1 Cd2+/Zn2+-exporting ATPase [Salinicoccus alkaliphilus DSM 16010]